MLIKSKVLNIKEIILFVGLLFLIGFALIAIPSYKNTIRPSGIIVHHSAIPVPIGNQAVDAKIIEEIHRKKGYGIFYWGKNYSIGYHYVISPDGDLQKGRPETCQGAHTSGQNDKIGICLIGEFTSENQNTDSEPNFPTDQQIKTLSEITNKLLEKYSLDKSKVFTHRQFNSDTECPGENFPFNKFLDEIENRPLDNIKSNF